MGYGSMYGSLGACLRGNLEPSFPFVVYERVKRRLAQGAHSCGQKTDDGDSSYAYTGCIEVSAPSLERHGSLWSKRGGVGSLWFS